MIDARQLRVRIKKALRGGIMKKSELIHKLSEKTSIPKDKAAQVVNTILDEITDALSKGERVEIRNFGNFTVRVRNAHIGRNPKTGESVAVPEKKTPYFKPGLELQNRVKNGQ